MRPLFIGVIKKYRTPKFINTKKEYGELYLMTVVALWNISVILFV